MVNDFSPSGTSNSLPVSKDLHPPSVWKQLLGSCTEADNDGKKMHHDASEVESQQKQKQKNIKDQA